MKHIGLIGGLSPESTIEYYKIICEEYNRLKGGFNFPAITIRSLNLQEIAELMEEIQWSSVADKIVTAAYDLQRAGADFAAITSNTPHNAYDMIKKMSPIEILSIMDATAEEIKKDGFSRVGLLGTKYTMELGYFERALEQHGIETIVPDAQDRGFVNHVIWEELVHGKVTYAAKQGYQEIIQKMVNRGAQGVILGCTEIPLLIKPEDVPLKTYDTATIHAKAILGYALRLENDIIN